jgi:hypothetical protein
MIARLPWPCVRLGCYRTERMFERCGGPRDG